MHKYQTLDEYYDYTIGQVNTKANPCEDIVGYACSEITEYEDVNKVYCPVGNRFFQTLLRGETMTTSGNIKKIVDAFDECTSHKNLHLALEQIDTLRSIGNYPSNSSIKNNTWTEVARLNAALNSYLQPSLVGFLLYPASLDEVTMFVLDLFSTPAPLNSIINSMISVGNVEPESAKIAAKNVYTFYRNYLRIHDQRAIAPEENFLVTKDTLKELIPEYDWDEHFHIMDLNLNNSLTNIKKRPFDVKRMRAAAKLINSTDPNIVVDYLVYKHIEFLNMTQCGCEMGYYRPYLLNRLWNRHINKQDEINQLNLLQRFEYNMNKFTNSFANSSTKLTLDSLVKLRNVMRHRKQFLAESYIDAFYNSTVVKHNYMYGNNVNMIHIAVTGFLKFYNDNMKQSMKYDMENILVGEYDRTVDIQSLNKPMIHLYASQNLRLWNSLFWENSPFDNLSVSTNCTLTASHILRNYEFLGDFAAMKMNYFDYLDYIAENPHIGNKHEFKDLQKLFFVANIQDKFRKHENSKLHSLIRVFRYMPEYSEAFDCKEGNEMHEARVNCTLDDCLTIHRGSQLLPFNTPGCY